MKKSLVALAVLAAAGAVSAQSSVTLSGRYGVAYQNIKDTDAFNVTAKKNGFATTDGHVTFAAVEDLGGGLKAGVSSELKLRGRGAGSVAGRNGTVYMQTNFGRFTLGAVEGGNGIIGNGGAGGTMIGLDNNRVLDGGADLDMLRYDAALGGGFGVNAVLVDSIGTPGTGGLEKTATTRGAAGLGGSYANGPIAAALDFTRFKANAAGGGSAVKSRVRTSGSYDLGVAKLGAGFQTKKSYDGTKDDQMIFGVAVPFGPATVGLNYGLRKNKTGNTTNFERSGVDFGVNYALSKRTSILMAIESDKTKNTTVKNNEFRTRLLHTF